MLDPVQFASGFPCPFSKAYWNPIIFIGCTAIIKNFANTLLHILHAKEFYAIKQYMQLSVLHISLV